MADDATFGGSPLGRATEPEGEQGIVGKLVLRTAFYLSARNHHMHVLSR